MQPSDVAIIGLACRFPAAANPREFWHLLRDGREATESLAGVADFDAGFFHLSPREAASMDPRQRLALELTWELFEDAFVVPETMRGQEVAVYLGAMNDDYALLTLAANTIDHHSFAGTSRGMIANRVSYVFGMRGPSMTVDSGQSSSLVAVHLACETLRAETAPLAIAGGIHLNLAPETAKLETEFGAMSASGHTYAFDARADGYVRGEGGALVLLKPLHAALDDGNRIHAVIAGSAVGNAGHGAAGLTVPSVSGQADVIRRALASAGLDRTQVDYVEAHGAGTEIGDPIEAQALGEIFAQRQHRPVSIGSVKTNIGHTGGAAGIAGLLKAVLAIENGVLPASLNYVGAKTGIDLKRLGLRVNTELTPWAEPRRAGVSSFGMGGTNAHVIVQQAPAVSEHDAAERETGTPDVAWVLSARSAPALANQAGRLLAWVGADQSLSALDVGWSLVSTRSVFEHRAVVVGTDRAQLMAGLAGLAAGEPGSGAVVGRARSAVKTAFVFPGQGSQWLGMGRELYGRFAVFARALDDAVEALDAHTRLSVRQVMWGSDAALLQSTEFAQPALFAVEVALAALLQDCGVLPDFVMGHSVGEITAAYVAGVLSLADAARMVAARGRLMTGLPGGGAMVAVAAPEQEVADLLADGVEIAAVNAADSVVISGEEAAVGAVVDRLRSRGRRVHRLAVSHAFHSVLMEPMLAEFSAVLAQVSVKRPRISLVSNVTGQLAGPGYGSAGYWVEHVRKPVRFADGVALAESLGAGIFVEVGPGAGLTASVPLLAKDRPEGVSLLTGLGRLFTAGVGVGWGALLSGGRRVELPTYGFARQRFWLAGGAGHPADRTGESGAIDRASTEQHRELVELVCAHAAVVLGHSSGHDIEPERAFQDLGFDSMTGVELRDRLTAATGLALPRTLIFDHPTPTALADHLVRQLSDSHPKEPDDEKIWLLAGQPHRSVPIISDDVIDSLTPDALIAMALNPEDENGVQ
ncbi:acyltransferase domain-containing protein [Mycobacterium shinjukuense]|uniref:Polyketide synthase n=1 Tax=Mycobacterium shinjukuense TaxID=398694 RepID=A0A7I7MNB5_9MYCO|nr:type I polyketide synthase [Mycobacterium shinjukuense]MCV6985757.1 acyltransferase domain-containing protein [Mycobacterium shinjukuense]ORB62308.1 polyketide synthase [Mycobacterium shinjukuense]BBX73636.1 polyketide synthase [Mycobacterium shinjukuense]